ncbi:hypothetical protein BGZ80_003733 [Entomortierella chlamydospora]|uniref:Uncharacterized protein n=1 Tax=Entomortierella chlamydospora TaxID=101097 RepID=A0A9P6N134_9FUNG|nr:hypothetical protein BGZ79_001549 [Entomortierella chlamydospora]KAG0020723.1 hypothetical protein BGZ80_003733 [Entomortierella chlamydospora]
MTDSSEWEEIAELEQATYLFSFVYPKMEEDLRHCYFHVLDYTRDKPFASKVMQLSDEEFRQLFRTSKRAFMTVVSEVKFHPAFQEKYRGKRVSPIWQLAVALARLGIKGDEDSMKAMQDSLGVEAKAVAEYTKRAIVALTSLPEQSIKWPNDERKTDKTRNEQGRLPWLCWLH